MAGRARRTALADELEKRTLDYFDVDPVDVAIGNTTQPTQLDYICARIESGTSTTKLAGELSAVLNFDVSYERLMAYLREEYGREHAESELRSARSRASHSLAEEALDLVDAPATDSVAVQRARNRAHSRYWLAERYNPERFGQSKQTNVSISLGVLHLDALRAHSQVVTGALQHGEIGAQRVIPTQETSS